MPGIASSAPPVLIGHIADATEPSGSGPAASCCPTMCRWWSPSSSACSRRCIPAGSTSASGGRPAPIRSRRRRCAARRRRSRRTTSPSSSGTCSASSPAVGPWPPVRDLRGAGPGRQPDMWLPARATTAPRLRGARTAVRLRPPFQPGRAAALDLYREFPAVRGPGSALRDGRRRRDLRRGRERARWLARGRRCRSCSSDRPPPDASGARGGGRVRVHRPGASACVEDGRLTSSEGRSPSRGRLRRIARRRRRADDHDRRVRPRRRVCSYELVAALARTSQAPVATP